MPLDLISCLVLFPPVVFGLAWPLARRLALAPAEKLVASVVLSLLGVYFFSFARYLAGWPVGTCWTLPILGIVGLATGRRALAELLGDREVRALLLGLVLLAGWGVGWLALVVSYSGGGWAGDWVEHWQRTRFFLEHWPLDTKFLTLYPLPARPPLANLVTGALLGSTGATFPAYQLFTTLLNSLAFLPAALLVRRFQRTAGHAAVALLVVLLMLNPAFVQNLTFAWTKLFTACLVLAGLYFFLRSQDPAPPPAASPLAAASLAAALLAHYSAGPYVVLLAGAWFALNRRRVRDPAFWRLTAQLGLVGGVILATWFGWALLTYGPGQTLTNASAARSEPLPGSPLLVIARNLRDTVVPHFLRNVDPGLITQTSPWGYLRDWFFQLYQVNVLFIFGSVSWLVLGRELVRASPGAPARSRWFWSVFSGGVIFLGVAVVAARDHWGLAHICLQALLLLGLATLAARWADLGQIWRGVVLAGLAVDFCLGIALQFGVQSFLLDRWLTPERTPVETMASYTYHARMNLFTKEHDPFEFFSDRVHAPGVLVLALLAGFLTLAVARAARRPG